MLTESFDLADIDGYSLRHLGHHLCGAGRFAELHTLLALDHGTAGNQAVNLWFTAHERASDVLSYLRDLSLAQVDAAANTDRDLRCHRTPVALGMEIRYALMIASTESRTANISPELLGQLINARIWSPQRGLDHARRISNPVGRARCLLAVLQSIETKERSTVTAEILEAATSVSDKSRRVEALTALAPHLASGQRHDILAQALAVTSERTDFSDLAKFQALMSLAPQLPTSLLPRALAVIATIEYPESKAQALEVLAPYLPADLLGRQLQSANANTDYYSRVLMLAALIPFLPADQQAGTLKKALAAATALTSGYSKALALGALAPRVPPAEQPEIMTQALAAAASISSDDASAQAKILGRLAPYVPGAQRAEIMNRALSSGSAIADEFSRSSMLGELAPHLPVDLMAPALAAATAITSQFWRIRTLKALAPQLPSDFLGQALAVAAAVTNEFERADALGALAPYLPVHLLLRALAAASAISSPSDRANALGMLAPHLPVERRRDALLQALGAASVSNDKGPALALATLARHVPDERRSEIMTKALAAASVIADGYPRAWVLGVLACQLPAKERAGALAQALAAAVAITDDQQRAEVLGALAPQLPADLLAQALTAAAAITDPPERAEALSALVPYISPEQRPEVMVQAVGGDFNEYVRAKLLVALSPYLPADVVADGLVEELDAATAIPTSIRGTVLSVLAPHLPADLLPRALASITTITEETPKGQALAALAPYLSADLLPTALAAASSITSHDWRARALGALAPYLESERRAEVMGEVLASASSSEHSWSVVLASLAPHLPANLLLRALHSRPGEYRSTMIALLERGHAVLNRDADSTYIALLRDSLSRTSRSTCADLLMTAAPRISEIAGAEAIELSIEALIDIFRWWP
jgi:hypothetical protein